MIKNILIDGMTCSHCARTVKTSLTKIEAVKTVKVNLPGKSVLVELLEEVDDRILSNAVESAGYVALCVV